MSGWKPRAGQHDHSADMVDVEANLVRETDAAFLISDGATQVWVPKSQTTHDGDGTFAMPEWLAKEKGFI